MQAAGVTRRTHQHEASMMLHELLTQPTLVEMASLRNSDLGAMLDTQLSASDAFMPTPDPPPPPVFSSASDEDQKLELVEAFCLVAAYSIAVTTYSRLLAELLHIHNGYLCKVRARFTWLVCLNWPVFCLFFCRCRFLSQLIRIYLCACLRSCCTFTTATCARCAHELAKFII